MLTERVKVVKRIITFVVALLATISLFASANTASASAYLHQDTAGSTACYWSMTWIMPYFRETHPPDNSSTYYYCLIDAYDRRSSTEVWALTHVRGFYWQYGQWVRIIETVNGPGVVDSAGWWEGRLR